MASQENYIVSPMTAMASWAEVSNCHRQAYPTFEAAEQAAIEHTMSEPWRTSAQLCWHDVNGWHRKWFHRDIRDEAPRPLIVTPDPF